MIPADDRHPCKPEIFAATYEAATDAPFDAADELEGLEWLVLSSDAANPQRLAYIQGVVTQRRRSRQTEQVDRPSRVTASNWGVDVHPRATAAMRAADAAGVLEVAPGPRPRVIAEPTYSDLQGEHYEIGEVTCVACSWLQRGTLGMTCPACSAAFTKPESAE